MLIDSPSYLELTQDEILDEAEKWLNLTPDELNSTPIYMLELMLNDHYSESAAEQFTADFYSY